MIYKISPFPSLLKRGGKRQKWSTRLREEPNNVFDSF